MNKKLKSNIMLLATAMIWGSAFVAQKSGSCLGPFTYNGIRTFIGGLVLIPVILILKRTTKNHSMPVEKTSNEKAAENKTLVVGGISCGLALFVASTLQQYGITFTTAGKTGFITSLYMVIVPFLSIMLRKKVRPIMWLCVILATIGLYLLCITGTEFKLQLGDTFVLLCAFAFAVHIMIIDFFSPKCDGVKLSCIQFIAAGLIGIVCMFLFEEPNISDILSAYVPILYAGICSCGIGYTLQIVAQADADPTTASLVLSLESVFSVVFGMLFLKEIMSVRELAGCLIIFVAVIISQLPSRKQLQ